MTKKIIYVDMDKVLERFVISFNDIYGDHYEEFNEEAGRGSDSAYQ